MKVPGFPFVQGRNSYKDQDGKKFGVAIHCTANTASDTGEAGYASRRTDGISAHAYVDHDSLTQSLDTDAKAGHAGSGHGNENGLAIEITGLVTWSRDKWLKTVAWDHLGRWLAYVFKNDPDFKGIQIRRASVEEMRKNPGVRAFYGHDDMRRAWGGTTHTDPGPNFPWDRLFEAVNKHMGSKGEGFLSDLTPQQQKDVWFNLANMGPKGGRRLVNYIEDNKALLGQILANQAIIMGKDFVDEEKVVAGVLAGIRGKAESSPEDVAELLKAALGDKWEAVFRAGLEG